MTLMSFPSPSPNIIDLHQPRACLTLGIEHFPNRIIAVGDDNLDPVCMTMMVPSSDGLN